MCLGGRAVECPEALLAQLEECPNWDLEADESYEDQLQQHVPLFRELHSESLACLMAFLRHQRIEPQVLSSAQDPPHPPSGTKLRKEKRRSTTKKMQAKDDEWKIRYKSFHEDTSRLAESERKVLTVSKFGICKEQTAALQLRVDIVGTSDKSCPSLLLQVSTLSVGIVKDDYLNGEQGLLGFYPDFIRLSIEPTWQGLSVPVLYNPDEKLAKLANNISRSWRAHKEVGIQVGYGPIKGKFNLSMQELENIPAHEIQAVNEGGGNACFVWNIRKWADGQPYNSKRPHLAFKSCRDGWPALPFRGTGPLVSGIQRVGWMLPENQSIKDVSFKVAMEAKMKLLWRRKRLGFITTGCVNKDISHTCTIQLCQAGMSKAVF